MRFFQPLLTGCLLQQTYAHMRKGRRPSKTQADFSWLLVALIAHTCWGIAPVLSRYLQNLVGLPSMSFLAVVGAPLLLVLLFVLLPRHGWGFLSSSTLWTLGGLHVLRVASNLLAARFTLAINVQLFALMTPFVVVGLNWLLLRETVPPYTRRAILVTFVGAILMLSSDISRAGIGFDMGLDDRIGIGLSISAGVLFALYMLAVRRGARSDLHPGQMLVFQGSMLTPPALIASLVLGESWEPWTLLPTIDILAVITFIVLVPLGANISNITAITRIGAPAVSSLMPWRLVVTLGVGWLILGERFVNAWQAMGAATVLVAVGWYLAMQWKRRTPARTGQ
jgi:drug/metabolite transporter (DMT)-like permease